MSTSYFVIGENIKPVTLLGKEKITFTGNIETKAMIKSNVKQHKCPQKHSKLQGFVV